MAPMKTSRGGESRRVPRVEKEIREVIGNYLLRGFRGRLPGIVSISRVIASRDLKTAKVLVTLMPTGGGEVSGPLKKSTVKELQAHAHEVQGEVNQVLRMKHCPRITFLYDDGFEHALKVEGILRDLEKARKPEPESDDSDENDESEK